MKKINLKKIGIAIYANEKEKIEEAYKKVGSYPDFIHVDLVDSSFYPLAGKPDLMKIESIKNTWPDKPIVLHVMSKHPSTYISPILERVDFILIHAEISEKPEDLIQKISNSKIQVGISIHYQTPIKILYPMMENLNMIQVLGIPKPGYSGQKMAPFALTCLDNVNKLKLNFDFVTCFDGGVTVENIGKIDADYIVSGSSVLQSDNPIDTILVMRNLANQNQSYPQNAYQ